jgi:hypothetical protein
MLAARGKPNVQALVAGDLDVVQFASERHSHPINAFAPRGMPVAGIAAWEPPDALALLVWLNQAALIAAIDREIAGVADDAVALAPDQREKAAAKLRGELLAAERGECALTWSAIEQKLPAEFRGDTNPIALLGVELIAAPATAAVAGPVIEHAYDLDGVFGGRS